MSQPSLLHAAFANLRAVPAHGWAAAAAAGLATAAPDLWFWRARDPHGSASVGVLVFGGAVYLGAIYVIFAGIARRPLSLAGAARYLLTELVLLLPLLLALALLLLTRVGAAAVVLLVLALLVTFPAVVLLQAWPPAQALSPQLVSPLRVFRATQGHRGGLVMLAIVTSVLNRAKLPDMATARSLSSALAIGLGEFALQAFCAVLFAACAAAAWTAAARNDPGLA